MCAKPVTIIVGSPRDEITFSIPYKERGGDERVLIPAEAYEICLAAAKKLRGLKNQLSRLSSVGVPREKGAYPPLWAYPANRFNDLVRNYFETNKINPPFRDPLVQVCYEASKPPEPWNSNLFPFLPRIKAPYPPQLSETEFGFNSQGDGGPGIVTSRTSLLILLSRGDEKKKRATKIDFDQILKRYQHCSIGMTDPTVGYFQLVCPKETTFKEINKIRMELENHPAIENATWDVLLEPDKKGK